MGHSRLQILLVDDDEDDYIITKDLLTDIMTSALQNNGGLYTLDWIDTYHAGLNAIVQNNHDVFLIDYRLGEYNGLNLIREAIQQGCTAPLILLTGQGDREVDLQAMQAGAADYLLKGQMDAPLLERSIRYALERKRTEAEIQRRNRELALLNHIIAAAAADLKPEAIMAIACRELALTFGISRVVAYLFNADKTEAVVTAEYLVNNHATLPPSPLLIKDTPYLQHLITYKVPITLPDIQENTLFPEPNITLDDCKFAILLVVPLIINDDVVGYLTFDDQKTHTASQQEINLAWSVADQLASALAKVRLSQVQQRLTTAIEQSAESIVITDIDGKALYVNPAFERITGYGPKEILGQNMGLIASGQHPPNFYQELWGTIQLGNVWRGRFINKRKDGSLYTEESTITPIRAENNAITNYVSVGRDVTREMQLEEQLRQSQKMDAIGQLAGGVAHDFNNLLTAIMGYTGLVLENLSDKNPIYPDIQGIQTTAERASALTRQLLAFARKQVNRPQAVNLNDLIVDLNKMLRRLIGTNIELVTLPAAALGFVKVDPGHFEQVLVNLVVNARDAMPTGGKLTIETNNVTLNQNYAFQHFKVTSGDYVMLAVSDNGIGMSEEVKSRIFEPFFTTKEVGQGTGLGMSTCFGIVTQAGGHIWVYSELNQGTTIKVYLPRISDTDESSAKSLQTNVIPKGNEVVLLVEDETTVRELTARILRQHGYTVLTATNGEEALRLVQKESDNSIQLIITDIVMPQLGGKELALKIKQLKPSIKILFISGYTDNVIVQNEILQADAPFLQKPFTPERIAGKVREVLDSI